MMRRRCLGMLLVVPLLGGCAISAAWATPPPAVSVPAPVQSYWPGQEEVGAAASRIDAVGPGRWPESYAGVAVDIPVGVVLVYRIPRAGLDAEIRAVVPGATVRMVDVAYSARQLAAWSDRVRADVAWWQLRGVTVHSFYIRFGECVVVEVEDPHRDADRISARYPGMPVCIGQGYPFVPLVAD